MEGGDLFSALLEENAILEGIRFTNNRVCDCASHCEKSSCLEEKRPLPNRRGRTGKKGNRQERARKESVPTTSSAVFFPPKSVRDFRGTTSAIRHPPGFLDVRETQKRDKTKGLCSPLTIYCRERLQEKKEKRMFLHKASTEKLLVDSEFSLRISFCAPEKMSEGGKKRKKKRKENL